MLQDKIDAELKTAMLASNPERVSVLRGLKSSIFYETIAQNKKDTGLDEPEVIKVLQREAKKRAESAAIYSSNGAQEQADKELGEKAIIEEFLPVQLGAEELAAIIKRVIEQTGASGLADMGKVIGAVKQEVGGRADGAAIAAAAKQQLVGQ